MRNPDPTYTLDWIATSLRWLTLLGMVVAQAASAGLTWPVSLALIGAALFNVAITLLAAFNRQVLSQRLVSMAGDMIVAYFLFYISGTFAGNLGWAGLLPLFSASLYFQLPGALLVSLANIVIQGSLAWFITTPSTVYIFLAVLAPLYIGLGVILSLLSARIKDVLTRAQEEQQASQREAERADQERRSAIYHLISALNASLNYQRVLDTALDLSASALSTIQAPADRLVSAVLLFSENGNRRTELYVGSARRFAASDMRITLPGTSGLIGQAIEAGEPCHSNEPAKDSELVRIVALHSCKSAYCLPLRSGMDTCGVLLFAHPESEFFCNENREILNIVGNQATIAIQNARLYQDLAQEKERMTEIQEEARKKMARDLHDGPTQSVAAIAMRVNFARHLLDRDSKAAADELFKIEDLARRTTKEIRHMLFTLRPLVLESQGLIAALDSMAEKMRETYNQQVIIQADQSVIDELEVSKQGVIFYIAEEAINNARKHARAAHIWIRLKMLKDGLSLLEIEDDGAGFDMAAVSAAYEHRGSLGMVNMRERTELLNGVMRLDTAVGRGTKVQVVIPLNEEAADRLRRRP